VVSPAPAGASAAAAANSLAARFGSARQTVRQRTQRTWRPSGSSLAGSTSYDVAQDGQTISIGESGLRVFAEP
jgi:hypothetical protein